MVRVIYLAVLVAAVAGFILGWLWYGPLLFLSSWMRLRGPDPTVATVTTPPGILVIEFARCLVPAYVIALFVSQLGLTGGAGAVRFGLLVWIGFPVVLLTGSVIWENVPLKVAAIHAGDWLVKLLVISTSQTMWRSRAVAGTP